MFDTVTSPVAALTVKRWKDESCIEYCRGLPLGSTAETRSTNVPGVIVSATTAVYEGCAQTGLLEVTTEDATGLGENACRSSGIYKQHVNAFSLLSSFLFHVFCVRLEPPIL